GAWYHASTQDSLHAEYLIFCSNEHMSGLLRLVRQVDGKWQVIAETNAVVGEVMLGIDFADVDCDGRNEIILTDNRGMAGYKAIQIVKPEGDVFRLMTPISSKDLLLGRTIDLVKQDSGCTWQILVTQDGPTKYVPNRVDLYELDSTSGAFRLVREQKPK
ncbi:MAG TPA: hypothetical protein VMS71_07400, partial [Candidatus Acidoferrum sp.]|nr:hypothetical protein [Candidatus Acidoferrum sp.]